MVSWCSVRVIRRARPVRAVRRLADRRRNPFSGFSRLVRTNFGAPHARLARHTSRKVLEKYLLCVRCQQQSAQGLPPQGALLADVDKGVESEEGEILTSRVFWPSAAASLRPCKLYSAVLTGHGLQICTKRLLRPVSESRCGGVDHQGMRFSCRTLNPFNATTPVPGPRPFFGLLNGQFVFNF